MATRINGQKGNVFENSGESTIILITLERQLPQRDSFAHLSGKYFYESHTRYLLTVDIVKTSQCCFFFLQFDFCILTYMHPSSLAQFVILFQLCSAFSAGFGNFSKLESSFR